MSNHKRAKETQEATFLPFITTLEYNTTRIYNNQTNATEPKNGEESIKKLSIMILPTAVEQNTEQPSTLQLLPILNSDHLKGVNAYRIFNNTVGDVNTAIKV